MGGHDGSKHWLNLVLGHHTVCEECLQKDAVDVCIGFIVWYIADQRRLVSRHEDYVQRCDNLTRC